MEEAKHNRTPTQRSSHARSGRRRNPAQRPIVLETRTVKKELTRKLMRPSLIPEDLRLGLAVLDPIAGGMFTISRFLFA